MPHDLNTSNKVNQEGHGKIALCAFKLALKREWREHELGYELGQTQGTITTRKKDSAFRET